MLKRVFRGKGLKVGIFVALAAGIALVCSLFVQIHKARTALVEAKKEAAKRRTIPVQVRPFSVAPNFNARLINSPYTIRDLAAHQDKVFAATSNGLVIFDTNGKQLDHWTPLEGFPSNDLTALAVLNDSLWIGTFDSGLIRYSNNQWSHFLPSNSDQRAIHSLLATSQGTLHAGTKGGILKIEGDAFMPFLRDLEKQTITTLDGDSNHLCIGTFENGLYTYEAGVLKQHATLDPYVTQVHFDSGKCHASTAAGFEILEKDRLRTLVKNLFVTSFVIDNSILWIATRDRGVLPFNTQTSAPVFAGAGLKPAPATVIKKLNRLLVASAGSKISVLENHKDWRTWNSRSPLLTDVNVSSLLRTRNGELWIGYFDRGLDILSSSGNEVAHFSDENLFCINHISEDLTGRKYVSTSNGLVIFQPDRSRKVYRTEEGLLSDRVMQTLPLDPEGKVVAIATTQGFTLKEGESMKSIYAFHGLVNNHIYTMAAEGGQIYLGTLGGISRVNKMQVTESWTQMDSGLKRNWVNALLTIDRQLFVGTYGSGVQIKTENGEWRDFPTMPEDLEINPNALYYDGMYLFCGTLDRGFYVYDTKKNFWKQITKGLPSPNVTSFSSDEHFLYIGTDRGLLQMTYDNIRTTADNL